MTMHRRHILAAPFAAVPMLSMGAPAARARPSLTEFTAPDAISRDILSRRLRKLQQGAKTWTEVPDAIAKNFPQVIEQNFAERDTAGVVELLDGMNEAEVSDLAQLYINATTEQSRPERLMFVLAHRLDENRLARVGRHFGFERTHHAVHSIAPRKTQGFLNRADPYAYGPVPGEYRVGPHDRLAPAAQPDGGQRKMVLRGDAAGWRMTRTLNFTPFLHMTIPQIYGAFRSAKYGSLSVTGALMETASVLAGGLGFAYGVGYGFGTIVVKPVVEFYMPNFYVGLGDWIGPVVDTMISAWQVSSYAALNAAHTLAASYFTPSYSQMIGFHSTGGDYGSVFGLWGGGGGGGCFSMCDFLDPN